MILRIPRKLVLRLRAAVVLLVLATLGFTALGLGAMHRANAQDKARKPPWDPHCGLFSDRERDTLLILSRVPIASDAVFRQRLHRYVRSPRVEPDRKHSAERIRLQCGLLNSADEIPEASALQFVSNGVLLDVGTAPPLFSASETAKGRGNLAEYQSGERFDVVRMLTYELNQPPSSPPTEFDSARSVAARTRDQVRDFRVKYADQL